VAPGRPSLALAREVAEECGIEVVVHELLDVHDVHFTGVAPSGRLEDYHGVHLIFGATVVGDGEPRVTEVDGTTDAAAWVPITAIETGELPVLDLVLHALGT
jgi:8-oxo-dGTP diphosphatase